MALCSLCNHENEEGMPVCVNCGTPLTDHQFSQALDDISEEKTVLIDPQSFRDQMGTSSSQSMETNAASASPQHPAPPPLAVPEKVAAQAQSYISSSQPPALSLIQSEPPTYSPPQPPPRSGVGVLLPILVLLALVLAVIAVWIYFS